MADLKVRGGKQIKWQTHPRRNKNSALPALCATLLTDEDVVLRNFPDLTDVNKLVELLVSMALKSNGTRRKNLLR